MNFLEKTRNLPKGARKMILWIGMVLIAACLTVWFVKNTQKRMSAHKGTDFGGQINFPDLSKEFEKIPQVLESAEEIIDNASGTLATGTDENSTATSDSSTTTENINIPGSENSTTAPAAD
jgi:hypothetical protein